jgi:hypothetical protein
VLEVLVKAQQFVNVSDLHRVNFFVVKSDVFFHSLLGKEHFFGFVGDFASDKNSTLHLFEPSDKHLQERTAAVGLPADHVEPFSFVDFDMELAPNFEGVIGVWVRSASAALDHDFSRLKLAFNELRFGLFGQVEILTESFQTVKPVMHTDGDCSSAFHWHVTNSKQSQ